MTNLRIQVKIGRKEAEESLKKNVLLKKKTSFRARATLVISHFFAVQNYP